MKFVATLLLFLIFFQNSLFAKSCFETRRVLTFNASSLDFIVAKINLCQNKIQETLFEKTIIQAFKTNLDESKDGNFSPKFILEIETSIDSIFTDTKIFKSDKSVAIAFFPFTYAQNGKEVLSGFAKKYQIPFHLFSEKQESILNFISLTVENSSRPESMVLWEIGSNTMSFTEYLGQKKFEVTTVQMGSNALKNDIIEVVQKKDSTITNTPNPVGILNIRQSMAHIYATISPGLTPTVKKRWDTKKLFATGAIHQYSVKNIMERELKKEVIQLNASDFSEVIKNLAKFSDDALKLSFPTTVVTDLLLTEVTLETLGAAEFTFVKTKNAQGALLYSLLWVK